MREANRTVTSPAWSCPPSVSTFSPPSPSSGPRQADSDWARPRPQSYYPSCSAANRPGRAPSGLSHSERLAGLGLLAERLRYCFRVVRHVHHTLLVDPLIELTPMRRGLIAGAGCCRGWSRRGRACRRIGDPHPVVREGYTVATKLVPSSRILNGEACKRSRLGARPRNHRWAEWRAQTDCRRKWGRGAGHRASDRNRSSRKRTVLRNLRPSIHRPTRRNAGSADGKEAARALKIRI